MDVTDQYLMRLVELWPPPSRKCHSGIIEGFEKVERSLGMTLPSSYKELVHTYGDGEWFEMLYVLNPFYAQLNDLEPWFCGQRGYSGGLSWCNALREGRKEYPEDFIYPIYPEPGGVFPWAFLYGGDVLYWLTEGSPDKWPSFLAARGDRDAEWERYDMSVTEILWRLASNDPAFAKSCLGSFIAPSLRSTVFT